MESKHHIQSKEIAKLIILYREGKISKLQSAKLMDWVNISKSNKLLFEECIQDNFFDNALLESYIEPIHKQKIWEHIKKRTIQKQKRIRIFKSFAAVASVIIVLGLSISIIVTDFSFFDQKAIIDFKPGESKAILKLSSGKQLAILSDSSFSYMSKEGAQISNSGKKLTYKPLQTAKEVYDNLIVPKGAEQKIELSDGTQVHLNANSELRFPQAFIGKNRTVFLKGEAHFKVSHDENRPFFVNVNGILTKVLGTTFIIKAYEEDGTVITTLVEGSVQVLNNAGSKILSPGQQSTIKGNLSDIEVKDVDVNKYTGWHHGRIIYDNELLDNILKDLSRWYNFELFYDNASAKYIPFSCDLERYQNLSTVLKMLEKTNKVKFTIYEESIVVETI